MLDIMDKNGKVVAVLMDDGTIVRKDKITDDIDKLIKEKIAKLNEERKIK